MLFTSVFSPTRHVVKAGLGSIFQRRENKGPGCLIGCGLNYPRSGLDWPESQLTSARCNFRGVTYPLSNLEDLCFLFIIKMTRIWFFFMKIDFPILFPWVCTFVILWKCWTAREFYIKQWYKCTSNYIHVFGSYYKISARYIYILR